MMSASARKSSEHHLGIHRRVFFFFLYYYCKFICMKARVPKSHLIHINGVLMAYVEASSL